MFRNVTAILSLMTLAGCSSTQPAPAQVVSRPAPKTVVTLELAEPQSDPVSSHLRPEQWGENILLRGIDQINYIAWSPSGRRAVLNGRGRWYFLDLESMQLDHIPGFAHPDDGLMNHTPVFWSEQELVWTDRGGILTSMNMVSGQRSQLYDFAGPADHYLKPGERKFVYNLYQGKGDGPVHFPVGPVVAAELGSMDRKKLFPNARLIGRLTDGRVLALEGRTFGSLSAITPEGGVTLVAADTVYIPTVSPTGDRLFWFTGSPGGPPLDIDMADFLFEPVVDKLWVWDGKGQPMAVPLGGTFRARAAFSQDGKRIALSLNPPALSEKPQPGSIAVVEGTTLQNLYTDEDDVAVLMWAGDQILFGRARSETRGGPPPVFQVDLAGTVSERRTALFPSGGILLDTDTDTTWQMQWADSTRVVRVHGQPGFVCSPGPTDPYAVGRNREGTLLYRLYPVH